MTPEEVREQINRFVAATFLFDATKRVDEHQSLLGSGVIDSTGILELIGFLETSYSVRFEDHELVSENFDSIARIETFLLKKLSTISSRASNASS